MHFTGRPALGTIQSVTHIKPRRRPSVRRLLCVASAIVLVSACNDDGRSFRPTSPSSSTPTSPSDASRTYTLSGVVFEMTAAGRTPIQGAWVYCDSCGGPLGHTAADTDANGFYSLPGTANGYTPLIVSKDGYGLAGGLTSGPMVGWITATVHGDTTFDLELVRR